MVRFAAKAGGVAALAVAMLVGVVSGPAQADEDPSLLALSVGYHDILQGDDTSAEGRVEYRFGQSFWYLKPFVGAMGTTDGAAYGFGGLLADIPLGGNFILTPSLAAGLYAKGSGIDLGGPVEFRSQLELSYRFQDASRIGISFSHISNASIYDENPGTETLAVTYMLPLP